MPASQASAATDSAGAAVHSIARRIRDQLDRERARINQEIREYPTPIPRCDQQFNRLLEDRQRVSEELRRLDEIGAGGVNPENLVVRIDAFVVASSCLDRAGKEAILSSLREDPPGR